MEAQSMKQMSKDSLRIVHVEDNDEFAELTDIFLKTAGFANPVVRFNSGAAALDYLSGVEPEWTPHVILLDLNMHGVYGCELLLWLRKNYQRRHIASYLRACPDALEDTRRGASDSIAKYFFKSYYSLTKLKARVASCGGTKSIFKPELFDELIQELDQLMASNNRHLEEAKELQETKAELALLSEYTDEMVVLTDAEGQVEWVNEPFIRMSGYTLPELRGKRPDWYLQGPDTDPAAVEMLQSAVHSGCACDSRLVNYKKDCTAYPVHVSLGPLFHHCKLDGFLAVEEGL
jgi:PAS domain S-box-containing protein